MNVGISLLATRNAHIWSSGLNQNLAFLVMSLRQSPLIDNIYLLNGGDSDQLPTGMDIAVAGTALVRPQDVTHVLDVVIEMGAQMPTPWLRHVRALGTKVVLFLVGQAYAAQIEYPIFGRPGSPTFNGSIWDEVWMLPQHVHSGMPLMRTLARLPVYELPHIWSPIYLEQQAKAMRERGKFFGFDPQTRVAPHRGWRVGIFEPNISVLKNSVIPMLACEHACRQQSDAIDRVMVLNTVHMKENQTFSQFALHLDITRLGKASYEPRVAFAECMAEFSLNAVVAHHWECELNYAYYDALYGGYPLVHNSEIIKDCGYYYPHFDCQAGGGALLRAFLEHDRRLEDEKRSTAALLHSVDVANPANIERYTRALLALFEVR